MALPTRSDYQLEDGLVFLNNGSFGAVPLAVQERYEALQRAMERNPALWLDRRADDLLRDARARLAQFVNVPTDDLVFFPNPTTAINMVVRSIDLRPGDEVVTTDHEYGAMQRTWRKWCDEHDARYVPVHIPLPVTTHDDFIERIWSSVTPRTRVLFLSQLTSPTALVFPVHELCRRARAAGILAVVDGAHVPAHLPLDLATIECDIYTGATNKWVSAPKGSAFLYARPQVQEWLQPLVTSWGWESEKPSASQFVDYHQWQGTRDLSPFLAVPAALDFLAAHDWPAVQVNCRALARQAGQRIDALTGSAPLCPDDPEWQCQMVTVQLPADVDPAALKARLYDEYRIEVASPRYGGLALMRVSVAAHTAQRDIDALVDALAAILAN